MELRFSLKLEFSYVLVNCQSPSLRKAEKKKDFRWVTSAKNENSTRIGNTYILHSFFCNITYVTDISICLLCICMYIRQTTNYKTPWIIQLLIFPHLVKLLSAFYVKKVH